MRCVINLYTPGTARFEMDGPVPVEVFFRDRRFHRKDNCQSHCEPERRDAFSPSGCGVPEWTDHIQGEGLASRDAYWNAWPRCLEHPTQDPGRDCSTLDIQMTCQRESWPRNAIPYADYVLVQRGAPGTGAEHVFESNRTLFAPGCPG